MIVSASRREDLPAYRMDWFMERLAAGLVLVPDPWNARRARPVALDPASVDCLAFWTRDPRPLLGRLTELEDRGYPLFVQVTITGYPAALEPGVLATGEAVRAFLELAARLGPDRLVWRYDPVLLAEPGLDEDRHLEGFSRLARTLEGATGRVVLSAIDEYRGTAARLRRAGFEPRGFGSSRPAAEGKGGSGAGLPADYAALLSALASLARERGFEPSSCAEAGSIPGLEPGACVDPVLVARARAAAGRSPPPPPGSAGPEERPARSKPSRPGCRCAPSVDVGSYGACPSACAYCYARRRLS